MCPISLGIFLLKRPQSQGHLLCWYMLFSREQTRYLQEDGGSETILVPVSTTEVVSLIDLWIQNIFMCSREVPGQMVEAVFSVYFWLEQPALSGADDQVVSGSSLSG